MNKKIISFKMISFLILLFISFNLSFPESTKEFSFAFLTDIHLQPERQAFQGYKKAIQAVNMINPDFVITGGDLIMDALGKSYERADSLYNLYIEANKEFNMPVYNTIGNHDVFGLYNISSINPSHPEYYKKMYKERLGKTYYSFDYNGWHFMVLDSIGRTVGREYIGWVEAEQMDWIEEDLQKVEQKTPIVISTHIPLISVVTQINRGSTYKNPDNWVIVNSKEVLDLYEGYNLKLVLQGHLHVLEEIRINNITFITGGAVSGNWWKGSYYGVEEGFLIIKIKDDQFDYEYIDYGWKVQEKIK
ncbi:MAG: metallophosphoesterase family protein [Candidatus Aminicenantaceae bacterium]